MIKIAHRGNFKGKQSENENRPCYLRHALNNGYNIEVDLWLVDDRYMLGHDEPAYEIDYDFIKDPRVWVHSKTIETHFQLCRDPQVHCFWHNRDEYVFTSRGIKWAYSGVVTNDGIMVMPDSHTDLVRRINWGTVEPLGICSDDFKLFNL